LSLTVDEASDKLVIAETTLDQANAEVLEAKRILEMKIWNEQWKEYRKEQKKEQKLAMIKKARDAVMEKQKRAEENTCYEEEELDLVSAEKHILFNLRLHMHPTYSKCTLKDIADDFAWLALCEYLILSNDIFVQMIGFCNSDEKWNYDDMMIEDDQCDKANEKYIGVINQVLSIIDYSRSDYVYRSVCFIILELMDPCTFKNKLNAHYE
jgi:hypothetical protein